MWAHDFRVSFTPLFEVLFTFPSRYWFAIGLSVVFSLTGWSPLLHAGFLVSRATQVPSRLAFRLRLRGFHPLRLPFPEDSAGFRLCLCRRSYNPAKRIATPAVWALALSLATTRAITVVFSSSGYWDVSVPRVRFCLRQMARSPAPGCPIRKSAARHGYLPLTAAYRSLSRPSSPPRAQASFMCLCFLSFFL